MSEFGGVSVPEKYQNAIRLASQRWNISAAILAAQLKQESGFQEGVVSPAGAEGIAQFMPDTARDMHIDPWNWQQAIDGMAQLDARYVQEFGDIKLALAAYNAGPQAVRNQGGIPPFAETEHYVRNIMAMAGEAANTSAETVAATVTDPFTELGKLSSFVLQPAVWRRIGKALLGLLLVGIGVYFAMKKDGYKIAREIENVV